MKSLFYICIIIGLTSCKSAQFDNSPPFKTSEATYNYWFGGQPGVSGIRIKINYQATEDISFDKIYFENKEGEIEKYDKKGKTFLIGRINTSKPRENDLVLDVDPKKEIKNKLPETKIPFELKEGEAVISYTYKGETKYLKVKNIKKTKSDYYP